MELPQAAGHSPECHLAGQEPRVTSPGPGHLGQVRLGRGRARPAVTSSLQELSSLKGPGPHSGLFYSHSVKESPFFC